MSEEPEGSSTLPDPVPTNHGKFEGPATPQDIESAQKLDPRDVAQLIFRARRATEALLDNEIEKYDETTGLLFGPHFREVANKALSKLDPYEKRQTTPNDALIVSFDGKGLKLVNDTKGYANGDILLNNIAAVIKAVTKRTDDIIGRLRDGGDEFGAIFFFRDDQIEPEAMKAKIDERLLVATQFAVEHHQVTGLRWCSTFYEPGHDINYHLKKAEPVEKVNPGRVIEYPPKEVLPPR